MKNLKLINLLCLCGVISIVFYLLHDIIGAINYPGYNWMSQAVSDLTAADAKSFVVASGLIFGVAHISNFGSVTEWLFGIPYMIMGMDFAYIYCKSDNIFTTMSYHMMHNLILLIIQFIR